MVMDLRTVITLFLLGTCVLLSAQSVPVNASHDQLISSFSSKANPYPDPTDDLFLAYPNPSTNDQFSIEMDYAYQGALLIQIYDLYGRIHYTNTVNKSYKNLKYEIDTNGWSSGMYVIAITGDGFRGSQRILKE